MFFRFVFALILAALVSMTGILLEKQTLERKRDVSRQYYQLDLLLELHAQSRLRIQKLTSPSLQLTQQDVLWSDETSELFAVDTYLVTEADSVSPDRSGESEADDSRSNEGSPTSSGKRRSPLPLLRWQQPVSPNGIDPNRR